MAQQRHVAGRGELIGGQIVALKHLGQLILRQAIKEKRARKDQIAIADTDEFVVTDFGCRGGKGAKRRLSKSHAAHSCQHCPSIEPHCVSP